MVCLSTREIGTIDVVSTNVVFWLAGSANVVRMRTRLHRRLRVRAWRGVFGHGALFHGAVGVGLRCCRSTRRLDLFVLMTSVMRCYACGVSSRS